MKFVIQRVTSAAVVVDGQTIGKINDGFFTLVGIENDDTKEIADKMVAKLCKLRIFEDEDGKTNKDINSVVKKTESGFETIQGQLLLISQFTLYADCKHGNRPSFINAGAPDFANEMYEYVVAKCREVLNDASPVDELNNSARVQTGSFGADMKCEIHNDGPFTILFDSHEIC